MSPSRRPRHAATDHSVASEPTGEIVEIFSGIQGEGPHVGRRQLFLRLAGCNWQCDYCDQPEARTPPARAQVEMTPGRRDFIALPNPLSAAQTARALLRLCRPVGLYHAVALTGGEPLMQADFLAALLPQLKEEGLALLLETNGTRPDALAPLLPLLDIVSMDLKLRSATGRPMPSAAHEAFLRAAVKAGVQSYAKVVITSRTTSQEIARAAALVARVSAETTLVLQPVTAPANSRLKPPSPELTLDLQQAAARRLKDVRVIPQTHKIIGQR